MRIGRGLVQGEPTFAWDTGTWFDQRALRSLPDGAINGRCTDVSKSHVDALWEAVTGYSTSVDPIGNVGPMIVKSEENGAHDGRLVSASMARRGGYVYQRFIDTRSGGWLHSTRPVIIGREIVVALEFRRTEGDLFFGTNRCVARAPEAVYSRVEHEQLLAFAEGIGLEFGELDVFRDRDSKLIYVIDANRTSFRPAHIGRADFARLYSAAVPAFARLLKERGG
jgi:hypothetical protein